LFKGLNDYLSFFLQLPVLSEYI